jgi:hypothetical protein
MGGDYTVFYQRRAWGRAKERLKKLGLWLWGALGLVFLGGYAAAVMNEIAPAPKDLVCLAKEQFRNPAPGTQFTILISNLAGDPDGQQTNLVRDAFLNERGLDVRRTCRVVALDIAGRSLASAEAMAADEDRKLLTNWNADLLIWGEVIEQNKELHLWFLSREEGTTLRALAYSLTEKITLPLDFKRDFADQLESIALSRLDFKGPQLKSTLEKLRDLLSETTGSRLRPQRAALYYAFGRAANEFGTEKLDLQWLNQAVVAYRETLQIWTHERVPLGWAAVQQSLADTLALLGAIEPDDSKCEQALELYNEALSE